VVLRLVDFAHPAERDEPLDAVPPRDHLAGDERRLLVEQGSPWCGPPRLRHLGREHRPRAVIRRHNDHFVTKTGSSLRSTGRRAPSSPSDGSPPAPDRCLRGNIHETIIPESASPQAPDATRGTATPPAGRARAPPGRA